MKRWILTIITCALGATGAFAQGLNPGMGGVGPGTGGSTGRPMATLGSPLGGGIGSGAGSVGSPYLNLLRGGSGAAINYYGIVRPQQNLQMSLQGLQQQMFSGGGEQDDAQASPGVILGTRVRFLNTGGYFLNLNGGTTLMGGGSSAGTGSNGGGGSSRGGVSPIGTFSGLGNGGMNQNLQGGIAPMSGGGRPR